MVNAVHILLKVVFPLDERLSLDAPVPALQAVDLTGEPFSLAAVLQHRHAILVFLRGFA